MIVQSKARQILFGLLVTSTSIYSQDGFMEIDGINDQAEYMEVDGINRMNQAAALLPETLDNNLALYNANNNRVVINNEINRNNVVDNRVVMLVEQILHDANPIGALQGAIANGHETEIMNFINQRFIENGMARQNLPIGLNQPDNRLWEERRNRNNINWNHLNNNAGGNLIREHQINPDVQPGYNQMFVQFPE